MDLHLHGKRALITGSTAGIGAAIAKALAAEGASVILHGRKEEAARRLAAEIEPLAPVAVALGDLTNDGDVASIGDSALAAFGGIDILVNNALDFGPKSWFDVEPEDWARLYTSTVIAAASLVRAVAPGMKERGWGRLIQVGSSAGALAFPTSPHYGAAKAALLNFSAGLSKELGPFGISVNTVSPGPIATETVKEHIQEFFDQRGKPDMTERAFFDFLSKQPFGGMIWNPLGRLGRVEEVGALIAFVASPVAGFINGANLRIDGGVISTINP